MPRHRTLMDQQCGWRNTVAAKEEFSIVFVVKVVDRINGTEGNVLDLLKIDEYNLLGIGVVPHILLC